ncbi:30S ribosomal protein S31 [Citrus sinensis]|nr:30S ribosomal protein S31, chloroplastic [Citrus sinensis]KAH9672832.1 30S ribosomal protein S31 [Citrus sinensis]
MVSKRQETVTRYLIFENLAEAGSQRGNSKSAMASLLVGALPLTPQSRISSSQSQILGTPLSLSCSLSLPSTPSPSIPYVYCGRGDKKTAKGKRFNHSFGNARPRDKKKGRGPPRVTAPPAPPRKDRFDDGEKIHIDLDESLFSN